MSKILMTSIKAHRYAGKMRSPGQQYEATGRSDAALMVALKHATIATPESLVAQAEKAAAQVAAPATDWYQRRDQTAAPAKKVAAKKAATKTSGYKRRDQVADSE